MAGTTFINLSLYPFAPRPARMVVAAVLVVLLVVAAFRLPRTGDAAPGAVPAPPVVAGIGLLAGAVLHAERRSPVPSRADGASPGRRCCP